MASIGRRQAQGRKVQTKKTSDDEATEIETKKKKYEEESGARRYTKRQERMHVGTLRDAHVATRRLGGP
jgi:hypothetical protein